MRYGGEKLRTLKISAIAIASVVFVEMFLGLLVGSLAILSDGAHALLDVMATFILLLAARASMKPPDEDHTYGHGKIEPLGGFIGGVILLGTAFLLAFESILRIVNNELYLIQEWRFAGFIAIAYTICVDVLRVTMLHKAEKEGITVKADLYHAMADLSSTLLALFGFGFAVLGFPTSDALASLVLSATLGYLSVKLAWTSGMELSDAVSRDIVEKVRREIASIKEVSNVRSIRVRRVGNRVFVEATVQAPDYFSFEESHALASKIEEKLKQCFESPEVVVHVEPLEHGIAMEKRIEKLAREVEGVKDVHEVSIAHSNGKLYVILHARVNPALSVQEAHDIAETIERKLRNTVDVIEHITVHVEPLEDKARGPVVEDMEIWRTVNEVVKSFQNVLSLKGLTTYVIEGKRHINLDCYFKGRIPIEKAHKIASEIENAIRNKLTETIVTVHIEPAREKLE